MFVKTQSSEDFPIKNCAPALHNQPKAFYCKFRLVYIDFFSRGSSHYEAYILRIGTIMVERWSNALWYISPSYHVYYAFNLVLYLLFCTFRCVLNNYCQTEMPITQYFWQKLRNSFFIHYIWNVFFTFFNIGLQWRTRFNTDGLLYFKSQHYSKLCFVYKQRQTSVSSFGASYLQRVRK